MPLATCDEIDEYLYKVKKLINENVVNLKIATNRDKNFKFFIKYGLNKKSIVDILNKLTLENFREKVLNKKEKFKEEELYIFSATEILVDCSGMKML